MLSAFIKPFKILLLLGASVASAQQEIVANYDESKIGKITLPQALKSGTVEIKTAEQWQQTRRPEILKLYEEHVYGRIQPKPNDLKFELISAKPDALGGKATRKIVHISLTQHPQWKGMDVMLYTPNGASKCAPIFVGLSFKGNHEVTPETDVPFSNSAIQARGGKSRQWPIGEIIDNGFALATACYLDIEPDHPSGWKEGVRSALHPAGVDADWKNGDWGAIGAWSWGLSRMLDYLETEPSVNARQAAVIGHSRLGKAALWAGASDPRFALVISNNSGEGGAALMRRNFGETTANVISLFPHWFTPTYANYAGRESECPVDQHMLIALIAPRPVYIASAIEDTWADPKGEFLSGKYAESVYDLFGKSGLGVDQQPAMDQPVGDSIGYHLRAGKHDVMNYDWQQYLKFARRHLISQ
ncbi:MAG: acetylxylan esterase [Gloeobacteraceae cyanobacterium ES-bin-144]|nr:acetylxylan esterase [Verrucomicrobiales bacterium]